MIQWIDEEYNYISPQITDNEIFGVSINGIDYMDEGDGEICVHIAALKGFKCNELPPGKHIIPAIDFDKNLINQGEFPGELLFKGSSVYCIIPYAIKADGYTGLIDQNEIVTFQNIYQEVSKKGYKVEIIADDEKYKELMFCIELDSEVNIEYAISFIQSEYDSILGELLEPRDFTQLDEKNFTIHCVIPALRNRNFLNVRYEHGTKEYGKDVIYQFNDNLGMVRYGAAQVKAGNISGKADGQLNNIIEQVKLAFQMPYIDMISQSEENIVQVLVICSGVYTNNAKDIILKRLMEFRNVAFLDGQDISRMLG